MSKFHVILGFTADVFIEAKNKKEALSIARGMLHDRSVYEDDKLDVMHDEAYCAGGTGDDPPLKRDRAYSLRDENFSEDDPIIVSEENK